MNENAKKWVKALRSGEYKQGKRRLHNCDNTFCCLGVLTDLYMKEKGGSWVPPLKDDDESCFRYVVDTKTASQGAIPPRKVCEWAGLRSQHGTHLAGESLVSLNDRGSTFQEIADLIVSEPDGLFRHQGEEE